MALSLTTNPSFYPFSKNQMPVGLTTDRHLVSAGTPASVTIGFTGTGATAIQFIAFVQTIIGQSTTMVFATSLDDSGLKLQTNVHSYALAQFIEQVAGDIKTNYNLDRDYNVSYTTTSITLTAKVLSPDYNIVALTNATDIAIGTTTSCTEAVYEENFKTRLDVYVEKIYMAGDFKLISTHELDPVANISMFDIADIIDASFSDVDLPDYNATAHFRCEFNLVRYQIKFTERYGSTPVPHRLSESSISVAFNGGLSAQEFPAGYNPINTYFFPNKKYMTLQPNNKKVATSQQEYLYLVIPSSTTSFDLRVIVYFSDGTTQNTTPYSVTGTAGLEMYCLPVGYTQLNLAALQPTKTVVKYEVYCRNQAGTEIGEHRIYYMYYQQRKAFNQFIFLNSLSGMDTLACTGELVQGIKTDDILADRKLTKDYTLKSAEVFKTFAEKQDVFTVSSGLLKKAEAIWASEIFLSTSVFVADAVKEQWLPITINKASIEVIRTDADLYGIKFDYVLGYFNRVNEGGIV